MPEDREDRSAPQAASASAESPSASGQSPGREPGLHLPFALWRWSHRHRGALLGLYFALLIALNGLVLAWPALNRKFEIEPRFAKLGQAKWLGRYEELRKRLPQLSPTQRAERCAEFLEQAPRAQLREILGRPRLDLGNALARALLDLGRAEEALRVAAELPELDGKDYRHWNVLGDARWALGQRDEAVLAYQRALRLRPHLSGVVARVCEYSLSQGHPDRALRAYETYRDAFWAEEGLLSLRLEDGSARGPLRIPFVVDGRVHSYPIYLDASRLQSRLNGPGRVRRVLLRTSASPGALRPSLARLDLDPPRLGPGPSPAPLLSGAQDWRPLAAPGSEPDERWLELPVDLPPVSGWGRLRLDLAIPKPLPPELRAGVLRACRALGREPPPELQEERK